MKKVVFILCVFIAAWQNKCLSQAGKPLFTNAIGVQAYTYRNSFPTGVATVLDSMKALGITEMEGLNPAHTNPAEFKKMLDEKGISMPSIGMDYNEIVKDPQAAITLAKIFGSAYVMVPWIPHGKEFNIDEAKKRWQILTRLVKC
jgi:sugar phosphate isomerase/epimerase